MINRSLIRIKTVQILYSYLLTRNDFKLAAAPDPADSSHDRQFAYSVYLDLIILLLKLSSMPLGPQSGIRLPEDAGLKKNRIGKALRDDVSIIELIGSRRNRLNLFDVCLEDVFNSILQSSVYKDYRRKRKLEMANDAEFWSVVFSTIIRKHKGIERVLRRDEKFSHSGFDAGVNMLVETLSSFDDTHVSYIHAKTALNKSLSMAYDLYHSLLILPVLLTRLQAQRLDNAKNKYLPTHEDLNPNLRFVDNLFVKAIEDCSELEDYISENPDSDPSNWRDSDLMLNGILDAITASDLYKEYMETAGGDFGADAHFWREIMRNIVIPSDQLAECLEGKSVYWNDDLDIMSTFALKTIRRSYATPEGEDSSELPESYGKIVLLPKFMNEDDEIFGMKLFEYVVENREVYRSYIDRFVRSNEWDSERLAFMDVVIMLTAIAEICKFPSIPALVSINEYLEIANDYSTAKSGKFINGMLVSIVNMLNDECQINKPL